MTRKCVPFHDLSLYELYDLLRLRQEVFVVEQDCPYLDADGKDRQAHHVIFKKESEIIAYTRLLPPGCSYENYASIGRVVNSAKVRGEGVGIDLMKFSIVKCNELFPGKPIKISAQVYLEKFYKGLGFQETGDRYLEDDIPHMSMILKD